MTASARHLLSRGYARALRRTALALCMGLPSLGAAQNIETARYTNPTTRYAHGILGDAIEHGTLQLKTDNGQTLSITLPHSEVFEDTQPRLSDIDGDGDAEVIVVQSHATLGAKLAIYDTTGLIAATPNIGHANRWLAPIGVADLDQDGITELAYIDRPHLAKTLRIWQFKDGALSHKADLHGYTNHRISERDIAGGIRICNGHPEMIVATADWGELVAITFNGNGFSTQTLGDDTSRPAFARAMDCKL